MPSPQNPYNHPWMPYHNSAISWITAQQLFTTFMYSVSLPCGFVVPPIGGGVYLPTSWLWVWPWGLLNPLGWQLTWSKQRLGLHLCHCACLLYFCQHHEKRATSGQLLLLSLRFQTKHMRIRPEHNSQWGAKPRWTHVLRWSYWGKARLGQPTPASPRRESK